MNDLLLLSGNDIPFEQGQLIIHQPTIKEIAYVGEENFYTGCEFLNFSKDILEEEDKNSLEDLSDFDILMSIIQEKNEVSKKGRISILFILSLIFPFYQFKIENREIKVIKDNNEISIINKENFPYFKEIVNKMFCLKQENKEEIYNPSGDFAKRIADKLKKRHKQLNKIENEKNKKIDIISRYVSILTVAERKDMNSFMQYTLYQLFDEFKRYNLKNNYDIYFKAKLAGAKDLEEVEDWMQDIHP